MAIRSVLSNSYSITPETLEGVPWELGSVLWQRIDASYDAYPDKNRIKMFLTSVYRQLDSVKVWIAFASAFRHKSNTTLRRKCHIIVEPNMKLIEYRKPITSPSFNWITYLTLSNITCSRTDLIQISHLVNIGTLTLGPNIQAPDIGVDDSIIRSWGRVATDSHAFSVLRVLSCRSQKEITPRIFTYLNQLPSLAVFNVEDSNLGPRDKPLALQRGWNYKTGVELSDWLVQSDTTGGCRDSIVHACFRLGGHYCTEARTKDAVRAIEDLPVLHLALGLAPEAANVDMIGSSSLRCFYRMKRDIRPQDDSMRASGNRKLAEVQSNEPRKKPTMRASKQQNMEDILVGFGR